jgi:hypothetical protein
MLGDAVATSGDSAVQLAHAAMHALVPGLGMKGLPAHARLACGAARVGGVSAALPAAAVPGVLADSSPSMGI